MLSLLRNIHRNFVFNRRTRVLGSRVARILPSGRVLDVGCGDGSIDALIGEARPDVEISGIDVLVRASTHIDVQTFDGKQLPFSDRSFDAVMFIDVLHHANDAAGLLNEARRVARKMVILKDHTMEGPLDYQVLRFMDWVGNANQGVALPYNYWSERQWRQTFAEVGLKLINWEARIPLYPFPVSVFFGRKLHFLAALMP